MNLKIHISVICRYYLYLLERAFVQTVFNSHCIEVALVYGFIWLETRPVAGCCKHGSRPFIVVKDGEFLD
jgi:hypothetical protein